MHNRLYGSYTGECASNYLDTAAPVSLEDIDWASVLAEYNRLHEIRTRVVENGDCDPMKSAARYRRQGIVALPFIVRPK